MARAPTQDHRLRLDDGRTIGYATWGDPEGTPVFNAHGMPGSRLDRFPSLYDPEWCRKRRLRFVGIDRPGYGYSDPWPEASLLECAEDFVRVADHLGLERFAALGASGSAPYVLAIGASVPERVELVVIVSGMFEVDAEQTRDELAAELGEEARALREDPGASLAEFFAGLAEVDRRMLERPDVRTLFSEMLREAVRQNATGWVDDNLRLARPWPFRLDEIRADVQFHHGEADVVAPPHRISEEIPGSRLHLYPGVGHLSIDRHIKEIAETLIAP